MRSTKEQLEAILLEFQIENARVMLWREELDKAIQKNKGKSMPLLSEWLEFNESQKATEHQFEIGSAYSSLKYKSKTAAADNPELLVRPQAQLQALKDHMSALKALNAAVSAQLGAEVFTPDAKLGFAEEARSRTQDDLLIGVLLKPFDDFRKHEPKAIENAALRAQVDKLYELCFTIEKETVSLIDNSSVFVRHYVQCLSDAEYAHLVSVLSPAVAESAAPSRAASPAVESAAASASAATMATAPEMLVPAAALAATSRAESPAAATTIVEAAAAAPAAPETIAPLPALIATRARLAAESRISNATDTRFAVAKPAPRSSSRSRLNPSSLQETQQRPTENLAAPTTAAERIAAATAALPRVSPPPPFAAPEMPAPAPLLVAAATRAASPAVEAAATAPASAAPLAAARSARLAETPRVSPTHSSDTPDALDDADDELSSILHGYAPASTAEERTHNLLITPPVEPTAHETANASLQESSLVPQAPQPRATTIALAKAKAAQLAAIDENRSSSGSSASIESEGSRNSDASITPHVTLQAHSPSASAASVAQALQEPSPIATAAGTVAGSLPADMITPRAVAAATLAQSGNGTHGGAQQISAPALPATATAAGPEVVSSLVDTPALRARGHALSSAQEAGLGEDDIAAVSSLAARHAPASESRGETIHETPWYARAYDNATKELFRQVYANYKAKKLNESWSDPATDLQLSYLINRVFLTLFYIPKAEWKAEGWGYKALISAWTLVTVIPYSLCYVLFSGAAKAIRDIALPTSFRKFLFGLASLGLGAATGYGVFVAIPLIVALIVPGAIFGGPLLLLGAVVAALLVCTISSAICHYGIAVALDNRRANSLAKTYFPEHQEMGGKAFKLVADLERALDHRFKLRSASLERARDALEESSTNKKDFHTFIKFYENSTQATPATDHRPLPQRGVAATATHEAVQATPATDRSPLLAHRVAVTANYGTAQAAHVVDQSAAPQQPGIADHASYRAPPAHPYMRARVEGQNPAQGDDDIDARSGENTRPF